MTEILVTKNIEKNAILSLDGKISSALSDPVRLKILHALTFKAMSPQEISAALKILGETKATSTVRHHLGIMKKAGLVDVCRIEENRGALTKYYSPTIGICEPVKTPGKFHSKSLTELTRRLTKIVVSIAENEPLASKSTCPLCNINHTKEARVIEVLNYALARALESEDFRHLAANSANSQKDGRPPKKTSNDA